MCKEKMFRCNSKFPHVHKMETMHYRHSVGGFSKAVKVKWKDVWLINELLMEIYMNNTFYSRPFKKAILLFLSNVSISIPLDMSKSH